MAETDLIDFNIIEEQKENIQALPSGDLPKRWQHSTHLRLLEMLDH